MPKDKAIAIKVDEQEDRLKELEQRRKDNRRMMVYGVLASTIFVLVSLVFAALQLGWAGYELDTSSARNNYLYWAVYLLTAALPLAAFLIARRTIKKRRSIDPNMGTLVTPSGVIAYDKRDYDTRIPEGNHGVVTQVKIYKHDNPEDNWEGKVEFENGRFNCWSSDELTKGVKVKIVIREGGEPEVAYDDDLTNLQGVVKKQFGESWLIHFPKENKFGLGTSKEELSPGTDVVVIADNAPGVDVLPAENPSEEE